MESRHDSGAGPTPAIRFVFAVQDGQVELVSRHELEMTLLPGAPTGRDAPLAEFAAELRDGKEQVLHRVHMPNPLAPHLEVFGDEGDTIVRADVERVSGAFTVVVPAHEDADHLALLTTRPPGHDRALAPLESAHEVVRVPVRGDEVAAP